MQKSTIFTTLILLSLLTKTYAQDIIFERRIERDSLVFTADEGPNSKSYTYPYIGFGFAAMPAMNDSIKMKYGSSWSFHMGYIHKWRINNHYALAYGMQYTYYSYNFKPFSKNLASVGNAYLESEKFSFNALGLEFINRINFGRRGNVMGTYLDLGVFANFNFKSAHKLEWKLDNSDNADYEEEEQEFSGPVYMNNFEYGARVRFGRNQFVVFADYRLSDLFNDDALFAAPSPLTVGIQFGLFSFYTFSNF
jgi:hypothetical protein